MFYFMNIDQVPDMFNRLRPGLLDLLLHSFYNYRAGSKLDEIWKMDDRHVFVVSNCTGLAPNDI